MKLSSTYCFLVLISLYFPWSVASAPQAELEAIKLRDAEAVEDASELASGKPKSKSAFEWVGEALKIQLKIRQLGKTLKLKDFVFKRLLGSGTYGDVYLAQSKEASSISSNGKTQTAVKFYKHDGEDSLREYYFQTLFDDLSEDPLVDYMIRAYGAIRYLPSDFRVGSSRYFHAIFYEYMPTSLSEFSKSKPFRHYRSTFVKVLSFKVLQAALFMERHGIVHFDLKPGNVMVLQQDLKVLPKLEDKTGKAAATLQKLISSLHIKFIDFGMSADLNNAKYGIAASRRYRFGTGKYRPLEAYLGSLDMDQAYDMWSIGIMLLELAVDDSLFGGLGKPNHYIVPVLQSLYFGEESASHFITDKSFPGVQDLPGYFGAASLFKRLIKEKQTDAFEAGQLKRFNDANILTKAKETLDPQCYDLLMKLLRLDPSKRLTASKALEHPYFDDIRTL